MVWKLGGRSRPEPRRLQRRPHKAEPVYRDQVQETEYIAAAPQQTSFLGLFARLKSASFEQLQAVNRELWLLLSLFAMAAVLNLLVDSHRMLLTLYGL
jgi:hypothetical protein